MLTIEAALARATELRGLRRIGQQLQDALDSERETASPLASPSFNTDLAKAAFELLRKTAHSRRCKLVELAMDIIRASEALNLGIKKNSF